MASVTLKGLCKRFSAVTAVRDVNLDIADREFLVLVGPSGCGKTTTLRMVAGLEEISEGEIRIGERVVNDLAPKDRDIAMVFQNYALYPHMNVFENMAFGLKLRRLPREEIDRRVRDAAEVLGLSDLLKRKPKELSGGQRQRVALGRAIVRDPAVFLMDEPLSNLDAKLRVQMRTELKKLHRRLETTIIYVTHDQTEAMTMGDRIAVMKDGRVHQCGSPREIYERPADLFVAGFIGSPAMNFLRGRVRYEGGRPFLVSDAAEGNGDFRILLPQRESLAPDREVVLGVRPEDVQIDAAAGSEALQATVELVEPVGSETYLYARRGPHQLTLRVSTQTRVAVGDAVALRLPPERSHVFDAETERAYA